MSLRLQFALANVALCLGSLVGSSTVFAKTWAEKCAAENFICVDIAVSSADKTITLTDPIKLKQFPSKVVWKLPEGYVFNYKGGDGDKGGRVSVPSVDEISGAGGSDDDEGDTVQPTKRYKLKAKRLKNDYKYTVIFDEMNGGKPTRRFTCDPTIANSDTLGGAAARPATPSPARMPVTPPKFPCVVSATP